MKYFIYLSLVFLLAGCSADTFSSCFSKGGEQTSYIVEVAPFDKIELSEGVSLEISEGIPQTVSLEIGSHNFDEISYQVQDGTLYLTNKMECGAGVVPLAHFKIQTPNLTSIHSNSQASVISTGVLRFPNLTLSQGMVDDNASGLFDVEVSCQKLSIQNNNSTLFKLRGSALTLDINLWSGGARVEAGTLDVDEVSVMHRSTNDITVKPNNSINGTIYGVGNVILKSHPSDVQVETKWTGKVIY